MSGIGDYNSFYYYNNHNREQYSEASAQASNAWNGDSRYMQGYLRSPEQNYENRPAPLNYPYPTNPYNRSSYPSNQQAERNSFPPYHNGNKRQLYGNGYEIPYYQYNTIPPRYGWSRNQGYKRSRQEGGDGDYGLKASKKNKRVPSRKMPTKKDWTIEEAKIAFETEKLYNTSKIVLNIKFPDHELNKDIVSQFHPAIENVHFQQPCTPRFCCITLRESFDPDEVINALNKYKFGDGLLKVEYKRDRDDDNAVVPDDIDPLTLYLGSFPREVTKDDILNMYPNNKRIDIAFANKLMSTRYAFIAFRTAAECLEAFKKTHRTRLYSRSFIVRFRRLNGTFAVPGEVKPQNPPKNKDDAVETTTNANSTKSSSDSVASEIRNDDNSSVRVDTFVDELRSSSTVSVKLEHPNSLNGDDDRDYKSLYQNDMETGRLWNHLLQPKKESKLNIKNEFDPSRDGFSIDKVKSETSSDAVNVKLETTHSANDKLLSFDISNFYHDNDEDDKEEEVDVFADLMDFNRIYESMMNHKRNISMLKEINHNK